MSQLAITNVTPYVPTSASELQELVQTLPKVLPQGAQSKPPLSRVNSTNDATASPIARLDMTKLAGIIEYEPSEYTFTAYAGTRLADIAVTLAEHGQYMPFDPPFLGQGATLGGTIAAGISGSGRYRYGGLRDFILGVHLVDGKGRLVRGGGKVVKNAAGFDLPKLMVGSMGRLGILVSASFKVFPAPAETATLRATLPNLTDALTAMARLMRGPYDLEALDLLPQSDGTVTMLLRIGGPADVLIARLDRLRQLIGNGAALMEDKPLWEETRDFAWVSDTHSLVKVATTAQSLPALDRALHAANAQRRYAVGGNLAWIDWPNSVETCHHMLTQLELSGLLLRGDYTRALIGTPLDATFLNRVRTALDPSHRFVDFE